MAPKISVLMGIRNCAGTLPGAIESILNQTVQDFELILCDDGSTDDTFAVAESYREKFPNKIILLKNYNNLGLNKTLNRCLAAASGAFIARMDGDDLCDPIRFETELEALDQHPDMAIVSTAMTYFDENGTWGRCSVNETPQPADLLRPGVFCHAPCLVRREAYDAVGGYTEDEKFLRVEDYDLWVRMYAAGFRGMNLDLPLYHMRDDRDAAARRKFRHRINEARVCLRAVRLLKLPVSGCLQALRPIIVGLLPGFLYDRLHRRRLHGQEDSAS